MDENSSERDHGVQPLDALMISWGVSNHDLVEASPEQLNHKQVAKARRGRQLTLHLMQKVMRGFNIAVWNRLKKEERPISMFPFLFILMKLTFTSSMFHFYFG